MSRFRERKYTRWSDTNLRKPHCFYCTPTSEEEVPSLCKPQLSLPQFSITQQHIPLMQSPSNYCLCNKHCARRQKSLRTCSSDGIEATFLYIPTFLNAGEEAHEIYMAHYYLQRLKCLGCQEPDKVRESLVLHLTGTEVEEALAEDRQASLIQHLDLCIASLEALAHYSQSLQVSELAAHRVLSISHFLTLPQSYSINYKPDAVHSTIHIQQLEGRKEEKLLTLKDLTKHCSRHIVLPKYLDKLMNDHYIRKREFYTAVKNFKNYLSNFKISMSQIERLHEQYETILNNYQQSRRMLDLELPKVINMRLVAICEGFEKMKKFHSDTDGRSETTMMFASICEKLCASDSNTARMCHMKCSQKSELCQKCNINTVEHK